MVLLRQEIGDVLRDTRRDQGRTLRDVSTTARVSLGYLSEVERGQKEPSSELLASICEALDVSLSSILHRVSLRLAVAEGLSVDLEALCVPDSPADLAQMGDLAQIGLNDMELAQMEDRLDRSGMGPTVQGQGLVSVA